MTAPAPAVRTPGLGVHGWTLRRRVGGAFLGLATLLVLLAVVILLSLVDLVHRGDDVINRWQPAVSRSQAVLADLVNQETGVRGYALTGNVASLQPYTQYLAQESADVSQLRRYVVGHQRLSNDLTAVLQAADQWQAMTARPLIAQVRAKDPKAAASVDTPEARARFDLIRSTSAALVADARTQSQQARHERTRAQIFLYSAHGVSAVLLAAAAFILWVGLRRWVLAPVDRLAAQTRLVAGGELHRRIEPMGPPEFVDLGTDVETMRRRIADELATVEQARVELVRRGEELGRSNADLEQFAYVASHDLSEPLRKVANFCQLLERQYGDQLDDKARQYIDFAVDGAKRMQTLINDLLAFSRVGRTTDAFAPVDLGVVLERATANLDSAITAAGAVVEAGPLPVVMGDASLLTALLQNLVGNAVKYRGEDVPRVRVDARARAEGGWQVTVVDNGIGIDSQYAERIFAIFQRLHLRDEYGGTGIGLALSRKIVEFHGGHLWLDTAATSVGATFRFTLSEGPPRAG